MNDSLLSSFASFSPNELTKVYNTTYSRRSRWVNLGKVNGNGLYATNNFSAQGFKWHLIVLITSEQSHFSEQPVCQSSEEQIDMVSDFYKIVTRVYTCFITLSYIVVV